MDLINKSANNEHTIWKNGVLKVLRDGSRTVVALPDLQLTISLSFAGDPIVGDGKGLFCPVR